MKDASKRTRAYSNWRWVKTGYLFGVRKQINLHPLRNQKKTKDPPKKQTKKQQKTHQPPATFSPGALRPSAGSKRLHQGGLHLGQATASGAFPGSWGMSWLVPSRFFTFKKENRICFLCFFSFVFVVFNVFFFWAGGGCCWYYDMNLLFDGTIGKVTLTWIELLGNLSCDQQGC